MTPEQLKESRLLLGLSQEELAHELGLTVTTVNRYERGRQEIPHLVNLAMLYLLTKAAPSDLTGTGKP